MKFKLIWFDSFGAKSSCTLVETRDVKILIDPGVAIMHRSFPVPIYKKVAWKLEAKRKIKKVARDVDIIVISHYHWDHFLPKDLKIYQGKILFVKNPNEYINDSQRKRAEGFYGKLIKFGKLERCKKVKFEDPAESLRSLRIDFGDYQKRREELIKNGIEWFKKRVKKWKSYKIIPEGKFKNFEIYFAEGRKFKFGKTTIKFIGPLFHGIEYSRVGWVFATLIKEGKEKLMHTSDLNGPIIEDYADLIIREKPDYLILDGPMTYMLGYTLNLINFRRVLDNVKRILKKVKLKVMIWDHHLPREPKFRERTKEVWEVAKKLRKKLLTASEFQLGKKPVVELANFSIN